MSRLVVLPYKIESEGAEQLAQALGALVNRDGTRLKRIKPTEDSQFIAKNTDTIINWGNSRTFLKCRRGEEPRILNKQAAVANSIDKRVAMKLMYNNGVSVPEFRETMQTAEKMMNQLDLKRVFCRTILDGSGGKGIIIARKPEELVDCRLYVEGIPKKTEYRVHVIYDKVIDFAEKRMVSRSDRPEDFDAEIRNHLNGWVFAREGAKISPEIEKEAKKAVWALGLDFGAVDLAIDKRDNSVKVFEVNTSPGLEGTTLSKYAQGFQNHLMR